MATEDKDNTQAQAAPQSQSTDELYREAYRAMARMRDQHIREMNESSFAAVCFVLGGTLLGLLSGAVWVGKALVGV